MERKIVVVAPTFNEEDNIAAFIEAVSKYDVTLLIADSHSTDQTAKIVKKYKKVIYLDVKKRGLGLGLIKGIDYAIEKLNANLIITMEADLSNDIAKLPSFIKLADKFDLVIGSRYAPGGGIKNWSWWRKLLSYCGNLMLRLLSGNWKYKEFTNLYRAFNPKVWKLIKSEVNQIHDWLFVPAFVLQAVNKPITIVELPYIFLDRAGGQSKMNTVSYTMNLFKYAILERLKKSVSFFKFLVVGGLGFVINTAVLIIGVNFGMVPANAGMLGAEFAIISNFILNNLWTFSDRKVSTPLDIIKKFIPFNVLSFGSAIIQFVFLKIGELIFGLEHYKASLWYMIFYVAGVAVGLVVNYFVYSKIIWRKKSTSG